MPIRDTENKVTGGIGAVRYVKNRTVANIPVVYTVESGKTVLVHKENAYYKPSGESSYYLYNEGVTAGIVGEWIRATEMSQEQVTAAHSSDSIIIQQTGSELVGNYGTIRTTNQIDFSGYDTIKIECSSETTDLDRFKIVRIITSVEDFNNGIWTPWLFTEEKTEDGKYTLYTSFSSSDEEKGNLWIRFDFYDVADQSIKIHKIWLE